jgi:hypothetical protein
MVPRDEGLVENQERFRRANERLHGHVSTMALAERRIPFLCECADDDCMAAVEVTLREYEGVREDDSHFLIVSGHRTIEGEDVVEDRGPYTVVEKSDS